MITVNIDVTAEKARERFKVTEHILHFKPQQFVLFAKTIASIDLNLPLVFPLYLKTDCTST